MSENKVIATVKDYERNKIYRLHRRLDGLNELLETLDNTKIQIKNLENMKERIKRPKQKTKMVEYYRHQI